MATTTKTCPLCNKEVHRASFARHTRSHDQSPFLGQPYPHREPTHGLGYEELESTENRPLEGHVLVPGHAPIPVTHAPDYRTYYTAERYAASKAKGY